MTLASSVALIAEISDSFLGKLSVKLPRKLLFFRYGKKCFLDQSIQEILNLILKTETLAGIMVAKVDVP